MEIERNKKKFSEYIVKATQGELMAMWHPLEERRAKDGLNPVEWDAWLQLNRQMEEIAPNLVEIKGR